MKRAGRPAGPPRPLPPPPQQGSVFIPAAFFIHYSSFTGRPAPFIGTAACKITQSRRETLTFKRGEFVRGKTDVQAINRNTHTHADPHAGAFSALCAARSEIYRGATAPLTSPIDRPELPLRLTGMSTGREDDGVCVCLGMESLNDEVFVGVFMG